MAIREEKTNYWVNYYFKKTTLYPAKIFLFYGAWPWRNISAGRGNIDWLIKRQATDKEITEGGYFGGYRLQYEEYTDWEKLLADEILFEVPADFIAELTEFREMYRLDKKIKKRPFSKRK